MLSAACSLCTPLPPNHRRRSTRCDHRFCGGSAQAESVLLAQPSDGWPGLAHPQGGGHLDHRPPQAAGAAQGVRGRVPRCIRLDWSPGRARRAE